MLRSLNTQKPKLQGAIKMLNLEIHFNVGRVMEDIWLQDEVLFLFPPSQTIIALTASKVE